MKSGEDTDMSDLVSHLLIVDSESDGVIISFWSGERMFLTWVLWNSVSLCRLDSFINWVLMVIFIFTLSLFLI